MKILEVLYYRACQIRYDKNERVQMRRYLLKTLMRNNALIGVQ